MDPGLVRTGVGVIETCSATLSPPASGLNSSDEFRHIHSETLLPPRLELSRRLLYLHDCILNLIRRTEAEIMAVEDQFYGMNVQTAFKTGQARGAALLAAAHGEIPVSIYSPARVKKAVVGNGRASKEQVQYLVQQILNLTSLPPSLDCSDALAVALCHAFKKTVEPVE